MSQYAMEARANTVPTTSPEDQQNFADWMWQARHINCFDQDVLTYPRTVILTVDGEEGPLLYMPVQSVLMLESLAPKPGLSPRREALALLKIDEMVERMAQLSGHREVYFLCKDDRVSDLSARHGFEELTGYRMLRKKVSAELPVPDGVVVQ